MSGRTRFCLFAFSLIAFPIVAWAQKTPGYTFHQITYPGSEETQVIAINDHTSAGGDVVGRYWYRPNDDEEILSPYFVKWGSSYLPLTFEGREGHYPTALNNPRLIVGHHPTAEGWVGFEYLGASQEHQTKEFSDIQFPGAVETWPTGVNDAGTVVGHYYAAGSYPPFILQGDLREPPAHCRLGGMALRHQQQRAGGRNSVPSRDREAPNLPVDCGSIPVLYPPIVNQLHGRRAERPRPYRRLLLGTRVGR
jgi:hypothetical protein